jgi:hypothetical protein
MSDSQWVYGDTSAPSAELLFEKLLQGMRLEFDAPEYPLEEGKKGHSPVEEVAVEVFIDGDLFLNAHVSYAYDWSQGFNYTVDPSPLIAELTQELIKIDFEDEEESRKWSWVVRRAAVKKRILSEAFPVPPLPSAEDLAEALYLGDDPYAAGTILAAPCLAWQIDGKVFAAVHPTPQDIQQALKAAQLSCTNEAEQHMKQILAALR